MSEPYSANIFTRDGYGIVDSWVWHIDLALACDGRYTLSMVQFIIDPPTDEPADERALDGFSTGTELHELVNGIFSEHEDPLSEEEWREMTDAIARHDPVLSAQVREAVLAALNRSGTPPDQLVNFARRRSNG